MKQLVIVEIETYESGDCHVDCKAGGLVEFDGCNRDVVICPFQGKGDRNGCRAAEIEIDEETVKLAENRLREINSSIYDGGNQTDELFRDQEVYEAYLKIAKAAGRQS